VVPLTIERLSTGDGQRSRKIRLRALEEAPYAFGTTLADASRWPAHRWEQQLVGFPTFVAVAEGEDVGMARGAKHVQPGVRELISLWVAPAARRVGVGAKLVDAVLEWARLVRATALVLQVAERNHVARAFYAQQGFSLARESMGTPTAGELCMVKAID